MLRQLLLEIENNKTKNRHMQAVADAYKNSYPLDLAKSLTFSIQATHSSSLTNQAIQTGTAAVVGATGGVAAGIAYTAITAIEAFTQHLISGSNRQYIRVSLEYLTFKQFNKNTNLSDSDFKAYKNFYYLALEYQIGKEKRALFGKNHPDDKIEDVKYFTVILIGHKLEKILTAPSSDLADLHKQHVQQFIKSVIHLNPVTETNSNDEKSLSLRTLLMSIDYGLTQLQHASPQDINNAEEQAKKLIDHLVQTENKMKIYVIETKSHLQQLITPYTEEHMAIHEAKSNTSLLQAHPSNSSLEFWNSFLKNEVDLNDIHLGQYLKTSSALTTIPENYFSCIKPILDALRTLNLLQTTTNKIIELHKLSGYMGITLVIHEILILNKTIQNTVQACTQAIIQLNEYFLTTIYRQSTHQNYKTYLCRAVSAYEINTEWMEEVSETSFLTTQMIIHKQNLQQKLAENAIKLVNELQTQFNTTQTTSHVQTQTLSLDTSCSLSNFENSMVFVENVTDRCNEDNCWQLANAEVSFPATHFIDQQKLIKLEAENESYSFLSIFKNKELEESKKELIQLKKNHENELKKSQEQQTLISNLSQELESEKMTSSSNQKNIGQLQQSMNHLQNSSTLYANKIQTKLDRKKIKDQIKSVVARFSDLLNHYLKLPHKNSSENVDRVKNIEQSFLFYIYEGIKDKANDKFVPKLENCWEKLFGNYINYLNDIPEILKKLSFDTGGLRHHLFSYYEYLQKLSKTLNRAQVKQILKEPMDLSSLFHENTWNTELTSINREKEKTKKLM